MNKENIQSQSQHEYEPTVIINGMNVVRFCRESICHYNELENFSYYELVYKKIMHVDVDFNSRYVFDNFINFLTTTKKHQNKLA